MLESEFVYLYHRYYLSVSSLVTKDHVDPQMWNLER